MIRIWGTTFWVSCLVIAFFFLLVTLQVIVELGRFEKKKIKQTSLQDFKRQKQTFPLLKHLEEQHIQRRLKHGMDKYPIMLWWSPLTGENGRVGRCGRDSCFFTINRTYLHNPMTKAILFYGTDFNIDSLPLPREPNLEWALFHEESPKNNYKLFHQQTITLFNHSATFSRNSHLPLTTQYLENLQSLKSHEYLVPLQEKNMLRRHLAPLVYVQSDCDPPSDRDRYVQELMRYVAVDSYGECLHNRDLPKDINNPSFMDNAAYYRILAQYKFVLAFENAVCEDYITEKLWRPLKLGAIPVYYGAPNIEDWLPSNRSAIIVNTFSHPKDLAQFIKRLDGNDTLYMEFLDWKLRNHISNKNLISAMKNRKWGVQDVMQDNYVDAFECMVCSKVWDNIRLQEKGLRIRQWNADSTHLTCPEPETFPFLPESTAKSTMRDMWKPSFQQSIKEAKALRLLVDRNRNFSSQEFWNLVFKNE
ncbi:alpha-(1,3)-fucosyltransferase 10 [Bombina bombina]|uniref:alpha-(1,3)-fucosyltransferase 10 n=1 Tax=Bombina bombina TaxID=8345 RepID=UPI00235AD377|nr:alpha-(1,3)-fucosyltransferase 10 [Bombina bombina]